MRQVDDWGGETREGREGVRRRRYNVKHSRGGECCKGKFKGM